MTVLLTLAGLVLVALALRDIFHTLFHPAGSGSLSGLVQRRTWGAWRRVATRRPSLLVLAGPTAMLATVIAWAGLLAVGWALVLWSRLPEGFVLATGLDAPDQDGFVDAFYLSLVTLGTLGYGDIAPRDTWLRMVAPLEAFVGFGLMTAAISWILSVYPVLARRRILAREVALVREAVTVAEVGPLQLGTDASGRLLADLTAQLIAVRGDLAQFPVTYFFRDPDERSALPVAIPELARLADAAAAADCPPSTRFHGVMLRRAVEDMAGELGGRFLDRPDAALAEVLGAYAADHLFGAGERR